LMNAAADAVTPASADPEQLFPSKLYGMLQDAEIHGFADIVSWGQDSPTAFKVHRKREFESLILPKYFKMTKYKVSVAFWNDTRCEEVMCYGCIYSQSNCHSCSCQ
jgi:hypothetical protein